MHYLKLITLLISGAAMAAVAHDDHHHNHDDHSHEHEQHGAHVHGQGELNLVLEGVSLQVELTVPAADITGFEHEPRTAQQRTALADALAGLQAQDLIEPDGGQCTHVSSHASTQQQGDHADIQLTVRYACIHAASLQAVAVNAFSRFPAIQSLHAQWIANNSQGSARLTAEHNRVPVR